MDLELFAIILENALSQLYIIDAASRTLDWSSVGKDQYEKCKKDRHTVRNIIWNLLLELLEHGTFRSIHEAKKKLFQEEKYFIDALNDYMETKQKLENTRKSLKVTKVEMRHQSNQSIEIIKQLKQLIEKTRINSKIRKVFVEKWIAAQLEQMQLRCEVNEMPLKGLPLHLEAGVHDAILRYHHEVNQDCLKMIELWTCKYEVDVRDLDLKIIQAEDNLRKIQGLREETQTLLNAHTDEMNSWKEYKKAREKQRAEQAFKLTAAIHIQAWWRMVMVRKGLGAFKKKPAKLGKKNGTKGGKKGRDSETNGKGNKGIDKGRKKTVK